MITESSLSLLYYRIIGTSNGNYQKKEEKRITRKNYLKKEGTNRAQCNLLIDTLLTNEVIRIQLILQTRELRARSSAIGTVLVS